MAIASLTQLTAGQIPPALIAGSQLRANSFAHSNPQNLAVALESKIPYDFGSGFFVIGQMSVKEKWVPANGPV